MMWTNKEIVRHLQQFPGEIHTESFPLPAGNRYRVEHKYKLKNIAFDPDQGSANGGMAEVEDAQYPPPPYNLTLYKGIKSYRLPRQFVSFLLTHPVARDYLDWVMFTAHAEEHTSQDAHLTTGSGHADTWAGEGAFAAIHGWRDDPGFSGCTLQ